MFDQIKKRLRERKQRRKDFLSTPRERFLQLVARFAPHSTDRGLVRIGPDGDGGYLLPNDIDGIKICVSPGVSTECGFDLALAERGIDIYMADASVDGPPQAHPRFHFTRKFLGAITHGSDVTIADFCNAIPNFESLGDLLLQMDIEGAEYPVILGMEQSLLARFRIIVLELHSLDVMSHRFGHDLVKAALDKLLANHTVVHLHPNNCCGSCTIYGIEVPRVMEMTLLRNDRAVFTRNSDQNFPHPLDADNVNSRPALVLPQAWR